MIRELKDFAWYFDEEEKLLVIIDKNRPDEYIVLDRTRFFSLDRFLIRISQWMSRKRRKKRGEEQ